MRIPFFRSRPDAPAVAEALQRIEDRIDRLIAVGERTNQLLERVESPGAAEPPRTNEPDQPKSSRQGARASRALRTESPSRSRRKSAGGGPQRPTAGADGAAPVAGPMKLHEAIIRVLLDAGEPLTANAIAARIRVRNLFVPPRSGHELRGGQVSARVGNATYRNRFVRHDGRIWLADPDGERRRLASP